MVYSVYNFGFKLPLMKFLLVHLTFLASFTCILSPLSSQTDLTSEINNIVEDHVQNHRFSGTILIAHKGQPIFHQTFGKIFPFESNSLENHTEYSIASITKLFTSIRILQLVESNQLKLDDSIIKYLPELQSKISNEITPHHLLLHISGLPNESDELYRKTSTPQDYIRKSLQNPKNQLGEFNYNNVDYVLLGLIIESITGQDWAEEIRQHILLPAKMMNTGMLSREQYPEHFAFTYSFQDGSPQKDPFLHIENYYAAGNMFSTATDLLKLDQALYDGTLISGESLKKLSTSYPEYNYVGYGVWNYNYPFVDTFPTIMERRGGILGANGVLVRMTDTQHTIIILSNNNQFNPDSFGDPDNLREALMRLLSEHQS